MVLNPKATKHPFDVARQGYVNLLPVQSKKSKNPGDSQDSILARKRFLQAGFYQPLQSKIADTVADKVANTIHAYQQSSPNAQTAKASECNWLDIGCGEGYYSQKLANIKGIQTLIAIDISKPAVTELAKSAKQQGQLWLQCFQGSQGSQKKDGEKNGETGSIIPMVASASQLPIADNSVQGISSIFSPILPDELARVLEGNGILVIAKPDEGHLASVRAGLFDEVREHNSDKFLQQLAEVGFVLIDSQKVAHSFTLNGEQLADLLTMTPYSYRAKRDKREALLAQADKQGFSTQAKFVLYVLRLGE